MAVEIREMVIRTVVTGEDPDEDSSKEDACPDEGKNGGDDLVEEVTQLKAEIISECLHKVAEMIAGIGER